MSDRHVERIYDRLVAGESLTVREARHVATCAACQLASADADGLDGRLREAARGLAATPIPDEVLDVAPMAPTAMERIPARGTGLAAAVVAACVGVGLLLSPWRPPVAVDDPSASEAPSGSAGPSAQPTASPTPTPTPTPPMPEVDAHLVGPSSTCADGIAGFTIFLPNALYAERRQGTAPGCRVVGTVREAPGGRQRLEPMILIGVADAQPTFEGGTIESEEARRSESGVELTRYIVRTPEIGALAGSYEATYVAELLDGRFLTVSTDADNPGSVRRLDELVERLAVTEPITVSSEAISAAAELFAAPDICQDPERGLSVVFPDDWWTNTAIDDLPACSWFAPAFFEYEASDILPGEVEITMTLVDGDYGTFEGVVGWETLTLIDRPATRWVVETDGVRRYEYVVQLGEIPETGPNLVVRTTAEPADLELAMAVLDELVPRISFAQPPPGATSDNPYITAPPASAEATEGDFRLELVVQQERYRAGQPIIADVALTYVGAQPSVTLWGSGTGVVGTRLRQLDGDISHGWTATTDCHAYEVEREVPLRRPFGKSGSFDADGPLATFYEAYFRDPLLRLPPGRWEITAVTGFTIGGDDCGVGPGGDLEVSVEIVVEP